MVREPVLKANGEGRAARLRPQQSGREETENKKSATPLSFLATIKRERVPTFFSLALRDLVAPFLPPLPRRPAKMESFCPLPPSCPHR